MNQENNNNISDVLSELSSTIQIIGTEKTMELLKISRENISVLDENIKQQSHEIIRIVCNEFNIETNDFYSRMRKNNRRYAIGITAFILKQRLSLDLADISYLIKKPNNLVSLYLAEVNELNPKLKSDIFIIERIENINKKLKKIDNE